MDEASAAPEIPIRGMSMKLPTMLITDTKPADKAVKSTFSRATISATRTFAMLNVKIPGRSHRKGRATGENADEYNTPTTMSARRYRSRQAIAVQMITCRHMTAASAGSRSFELVR